MPLILQRAVALCGAGQKAKKRRKSNGTHAARKRKKSECHKTESRADAPSIGTFQKKMEKEKRCTIR